MLIKRYSLIVTVLIVVISAALVYYAYTAIYQVAIAPKEINSSEIIAKKQKVNLSLFNDINNKINAKKEVSDAQINTAKNPFD